MKTAERMVMSLGVVLCTCLVSSSSFDRALTIRHLAWGITVLLLFISVLFRSDKLDTGVTNLFIFKALLGMVIITYLSSVKSINLSESLYGCLRITVALVYFTVLTLIIDRDIICKTFTLLAVCLGILGIYQLGVWMSGTDVFGVDTPGEVYGTMVNKNLWSELLVLMLPFCFFVKWKKVGMLAAGIILINLFMLFSRSAMLTLCVYMALAAMFYPKHRVKIIIIGISAGVAVYFLKPDLVECALASLTQRWEIWRETLAISRDNILLGVGVGNWRITIPEYYANMNIPNLGLSTFIHRPHNGFLLVLSEIGVLGLTAYLTFFGMTFYYARKNPLIFMAMAGCFVCTFFSWQRERAIGVMMPLIFSAIAVSEYYKGPARRISQKKVLALGMTIVPVLILACVCFWGRYKSDCFVKDIGVNKYTDKQLAGMDNNYLFGTLDSHSCPLWFYGAMANMRLGDYRCADIQLKKAYNDNPNHVYVLNNLGGMAMWQEDRQEAIRYFKEALEIAPWYEPLQSNLRNAQNENEK